MLHKNPWLKAFYKWLPFAAIIIIFSLAIYATVQQNYRTSANDPQIQIAEDIAAAIAKGNTPPDSIVPPNPTQELSPSLATFVTMYSATGTPIGSSAALNGKLPTLPSGVFDIARKNGQDRFTWQPQNGVRIAAVVTSYNGPVSGYVLAGRSLREVEIREKQLTILTGVAGLVALVLVYLVLLVMAMFFKRHHLPLLEELKEEKKEEKEEAHHHS